MIVLIIVWNFVKFCKLSTCSRMKDIYHSIITNINIIFIKI